MISAEQVKRLRQATGVGMMDCKKALEESGGDYEKAVKLLRERGAAVAEKRAERATEQGVVEAYIHTGGRIGAMVELKCESDFVAKTEDFRTLARDIAMQVAAMNPRVITREELSKDLVEKEMEIYLSQAKNEGKDEPAALKLAQDRVEKFIQENVLVEQSFIRDAGKTIRDLIHEAIGRMGEKIAVRRFTRFHLGDEVK
jgi:elongation factor Ts